jgi:FAD synthetase
MKKVLAGGTFNLVHPGHILFLQKAKELGDYLVVVVANDKTVLKSKGFLLMPAGARKKILENLRMVDKVVIGDEKDFMKVVRKEKPDIIALGYDQELGGLRKQIERSGIKCKIVRIKSRLEGYKTEGILNSLRIKRHNKGSYQSSSSSSSSLSSPNPSSSPSSSAQISSSSSSDFSNICHPHYLN